MVCRCVCLCVFFGGGSRAGKIPEFLIRPWSEDTALLAFHLHVVNLLRRRQGSPATFEKKAVFSTSFLTDMPVPLLELEKKKKKNSLLFIPDVWKGS